MLERRCPLVKRYFRLAIREPERLALVGSDGRGVLSRGDVAASAAAAAGVLAHRLRPGRVALLSLPNGPELITSFLALRAVGATVALADAAAPEAELLAAAASVNAAVALTRPERLPSLGGEPLGPGIALAPTGLDGVCPLPGAVLFKLTSGSSGAPRAIGVSVRQLVADTAQIIQTMDVGAADTTLAAIPLTHSYGIGSCLMLHLLLGTPLAFPRSGLPAALLEGLSEFRVRHFPAVPAMVRALAALGNLPALPNLRLCLTAGAPLKPSDAQSFFSATGIKVHVFFGSSECGGITFDRSDRPTFRAGEVGTAMERVRVEVVDSSGAVLPAGMPGRVRVTSPAVALGSVGGGRDWDGIEGRAFLSPDVGFLDPGGGLTLTGRVGEVINVAGKKVHPAEVRQILEDLPGVAGAVVAGLPDPHRGHVVGAVVATLPGFGLTVSRVLAHCRGRLAPHKIPRRIALVSELPVNDRGKIPLEAIHALLASIPSGHSAG